MDTRNLGNLLLRGALDRQSGAERLDGKPDFDIIAQVGAGFLEPGQVVLTFLRMKLPNKSAAPLLKLQNAHRLKDPHGLSDGRPADAEQLTKFFLRRHFITGLQAALLNERLNPGHDLTANRNSFYLGQITHLFSQLSRWAIKDLQYIIQKVCAFYKQKKQFRAEGNDFGYQGFCGSECVRTMAAMLSTRRRAFSGSACSAIFPIRQILPLC